jgi:hypothetical protein
MTLVTKKKERRVSDASGERLKKRSGWAVVRVRDGEEVAHFQSLSDIQTHGDQIVQAAWRNANQASAS